MSTAKALSTFELSAFTYTMQTSTIAAIQDWQAGKSACRGGRGNRILEVHMDAVQLRYIPATTRAVMSRAGATPTMEVAGRLYELTPQEMPGEVEWRIELLRWLGRKVFFYLASVAPEDRIQKLLGVEHDLIRRTWLHAIEAHAVAEGALDSINNLTDQEVAALAQGRVYFEALTKREGERLVKRFERMVARHSKPRESASPPETH